MAIYAQYQNAPKLTALISQLVEFLTIDPLVFYNNFFNLFTANSQGLDNWGRILLVDRTVTVIDLESVFGFNNGHAPLPLDTGYPQTFNNGRFYNPDSSKDIVLDDNTYRSLLWLTYMKQTCSMSILSSSRVVNIYAQSINPNYSVDIEEFFNKNYFIYRFNYILSPIEVTLFRYNDVLPRPAGTLYKVAFLD